MGNEVKMAKEAMLDWWDVFSVTGNIDDARMLIDSIMQYDLLLAREEEIEL